VLDPRAVADARVGGERLGDVLGRQRPARALGGVEQLRRRGVRPAARTRRTHVELAQQRCRSRSASSSATR
jgi:hypothetical protein